LERVKWTGSSVHTLDCHESSSRISSTNSSPIRIDPSMKRTAFFGPPLMVTGEPRTDLSRPPRRNFDITRALRDRDECIEGVEGVVEVIVVVEREAAERSGVAGVVTDEEEERGMERDAVEAGLLFED
jgi:hypothetical protein